MIYTDIDIRLQYIIFKSNICAGISHEWIYNKTVLMLESQRSLKKLIWLGNFGCIACSMILQNLYNGSHEVKDS